jgi:hypothetical protein
VRMRIRTQHPFIQCNDPAVCMSGPSQCMSPTSSTLQQRLRAQRSKLKDPADQHLHAHTTTQPCAIADRSVSLQCASHTHCSRANGPRISTCMCTHNHC